MSKRGRPLILDERKKQQVLALVSVGCSREMAAKYVGCHPRTIIKAENRDPEFGERLAGAERKVKFEHLQNVAMIAGGRQGRLADRAFEYLWTEFSEPCDPNHLTDPFEQKYREFGRQLLMKVLVDRYRKNIARNWESFFQDR